MHGQEKEKSPALKKLTFYYKKKKKLTLHYRSGNWAFINIFKPLDFFLGGDSLFDRIFCHN